MYIDGQCSFLLQGPNQIETLDPYILYGNAKDNQGFVYYYKVQFKPNINFYVFDFNRKRIANRTGVMCKRQWAEAIVGSENF